MADAEQSALEPKDPQLALFEQEAQALKAAPERLSRFHAPEDQAQTFIRDWLKSTGKDRALAEFDALTPRSHLWHKHVRYWCRIRSMETKVFGLDWWQCVFLYVLMEPETRERATGKYTRSA